MSDRSVLTRARTWVVKIGSSLLTDNGKGLDNEAMARWAGQITGLQARGLCFATIPEAAP